MRIIILIGLLVIAPIPIRANLGAVHGSSSFVALEWLARTAPPVMGADISLKVPGTVIEIGAGVGLRFRSKRIKRVRPRIVPRVLPVVKDWQPDLSGLPLISENYDGAGAGGTFTPPAPPTLSLSAPTTAFIDETVLVDARASTGVHNKPQSDGTFSFTMDFGDGTPLVYIMASGHAYRDAGTYTIRINGKSSAGEAATEVTQDITISAIPQAGGANSVTLTDTGNLVTNATNLNAEIAIAAAANTTEREIVLPDNFDAKGPITMVPTTGNKYITIRWANLPTLLHKKRINPETSDLSAMPTIFAPNNTLPNTEAVNTTNPATTSLVKYYRWQGIHIGRENSAVAMAHMFSTGQDAYNGNDQLATMNHHFIFDRMWFDSGGVSTATVGSGLRLLSNFTSVVDSWLAYFRQVGQVGVDTQALVVAVTQGPISVRNNYIVGSSENMHIGSGVVEYRRADISSPTTTNCTLTNGRRFSQTTQAEIAGGNTENLSVGSIIALPSSNCSYADGGPYCVEMVTEVTSVSGNNITFVAVPWAPTNGGVANWSDNPMFVEVRNNFFTKPIQWRRYLQDDVTQNPVWDGTVTSLKNLWETKGVRYLAMDGNVFTEGYSEGEQPYRLVLSVRNRNGLFTNTAAIQHVQWSNNLYHNGNNNIVFTASGDGTAQDQVTFRTRDILYLNNLNWNAGWEYDSTGPLDLFTMGVGIGATKTMERVFVLHNTWDGSNTTITDWAVGAGATSSMWFNNVHEFNYNGFRTNDIGNPPEVQVESITARLPPGDSTSWTKNLVVNPRQPYDGAPDYAAMPATAIVIGGLNYLGLPTGDTVAFSGQFVNHGCGDFTLAVTSPGKAAGSDGTDVGVIMPQLTAAIGASTPCLGTATIKTITGDWTVQAGGQTAIMAGKVTISGRVTVQ